MFVVRLYSSDRIGPNNDQFLSAGANQLDLDLQIDRSGRTPLPLQVGYAIREALLRGRLKPGTRLPPSRVLAERLTVARSVIVLAYEWLAAEGLAKSRQGDGTYIIDDIRVPANLPERFANPQRRSDILPSKLPAIDFRPALPALDQFPRREWRAALSRVINAAGNEQFGYSPIEGLPVLRRAIAEYVSRARGLPFAPERVIVTAGAAQALNLILRVAKRSERIAIEDPSPVPVRKLIRLHGAEIVPIPVDEEGLVVDALPTDTRAPGLVYVVPCHQFPIGAVMSLSRRLQLLEWATQNDSFIIEDDYDSEFRYDAMSPSALAGIDRSDRVIYVGTFSKTLCPALRLGYLIAPEPLVDMLIEFKWWTDRGGPVIDQLALTEWLDSGFFDRHVHKMRKTYTVRQAALADELAKLFGASVKIHGVKAGMHLMASIDAAAKDEFVLTEEALRHGVQLYPVTPCRIATTNDRAEFVFGFGHLTPSTIRKGARIFARLCQR